MKKSLAPVTLGLTMLGWTLPAHAAPTQQDRVDQIDASPLGLADSFDRAQLTHDVAALDQWTDAKLIYITSSGKRLGKAEFIAGWADREESYEPLTLIDRQVIPLGKTAFMVSAEAILKGMSGGKRFSSRFRFTDIFHFADGHWRVVHIQVTAIPE